MRVVSDTSPIYNLAAIGRLHLLHLQFEVVLIPPVVGEELRPIKVTYAGRQIAEAMRVGEIQVLEIEIRSLATGLVQQLDAEEAEALALASQLGLTSVLMNEKRGRRAARQLGLHPVGVLGVRLKAKHAGHLTSVSECLLALREKAGFYLSEDLMVSVRTAAGEV